MTDTKRSNPNESRPLRGLAFRFLNRSAKLHIVRNFALRSPDAGHLPVPVILAGLMFRLRTPISISGRAERGHSMMTDSTRSELASALCELEQVYVDEARETEENDANHAEALYTSADAIRAIAEAYLIHSDNTARKLTAALSPGERDEFENYAREAAPYNF